MKCPRCGGGLFEKHFHQNYGVVCRTCGLLGSIELSPNICFIPDDAVSWFLHKFPQGGWDTPTTYTNMVSKPITAAEILAAGANMPKPQPNWIGTEHFSYDPFTLSPKFDDPEFPVGIRNKWGDWGNPLPSFWNGGVPFVNFPDRGGCYEYSLPFPGGKVYTAWATIQNPSAFAYNYLSPALFPTWDRENHIIEMPDSVKEMLNDPEEVSFAEANRRITEEVAEQVVRGLGIPAKVIRGESQLQRPEGGKGEAGEAKNQTEEGTGDSGAGTEPTVL